MGNFVKDFYFGRKMLLSEHKTASARSGASGIGRMQFPYRR